MTQNYSSSSQFTFTYYGEELEDNSMSAHDLVQVVQGTQRLITGTNSLVNGNLTMSALRVKAPQPGSYGIEFALDLIQVAVFVGANPFVVSALNMQRLLFGGTGIGLIGLLKQLKGRTPSEVTPIVEEGGTTSQVRLRADRVVHPSGLELEGLDLEIPVDLNRLLSNPAIISSLSQIVSPVRNERIDRLDISPGTIRPEQVTKEDLPSFESFRSNDSVDALEEYGKELIVETPTFTESRVWRLRLPERGAKSESYSIRDETYKVTVSEGGLIFKAGTVLVCDTKISSYIGRDGKPKTKREILRVHSQHPGSPPDPRQGQFPFY